MPERKTLIIDLNGPTVDVTTEDPRITSQFIGGRGTNTKHFYDLADRGVHPLSGANPVVFGTGPLTGIPFPMGGRFEVTTKSLLTGGIFTSSCGGWFGVKLKKAGFDTLVITGAASKPSYIFIDQASVTLRDASNLWGKEKKTVKEKLRNEHGTDISIAMIGRAGENAVPYANVENDGRFIGRGGIGAILGAKNLKAVVVRGRGKVHPADREAFSFVSYESKKWLSANPVTSRGLPEYGTGILLNCMRESGLLSQKNFASPAPDESWAVSGEMVTEKVLLRTKACPFCPVACGRLTRYGEGPEFESIWALGVNLALYDIEKVARLNSLCNELGLDTISAGVTIGMASELKEAGKLPLAPGFGDFEAIEGTLIAIAEGKPEGEIFSQGTKKLGERYDAMEMASQVKGLELPAYDPRGAYGHALGYATSNRGGCHLQGYMIGAEILGIPKLVDRFAIEGKASLLALYQNVSAFVDSLVMCRFSSFAIPHDYYARIASAASGQKITWEDSIMAGERIWNLERLINLREGVEKDTLPGRFGEVPLEALLKEYYILRGWDEEGRPTEEKLHSLGLL